MISRFNRLSTVITDQQGSSFIMVGLAIMVLIGAGGSAIDVGRAELVQAKLSSSLDAAGLAAGSTINTTNLTTEVQKYMDANFQDYLGSEITNLAVTINDDNTVISLEATAAVPTTLMAIFGQEEIEVKANSEITRAVSGLELVMVLDNTGSMNCPVSGYCGSTSVEQPNSKLSAAKSAATDLVNIMYGDQATVDDLWIGLVPFSQAVNIGSSRTDWTSADAFNWGPTSWAGCVDAREASNRDTTDDPPSVASFPRYYWPDDSNNNWITTTTNTTTTGPTTTTICNRNSSCTCSNYGPCTTTNSTSGNTTTSTTISCSGSGSTRSCTRRVTSTTTTTNTNYTINNDQGPNTYCPQSVTPMTGNKTTILNGIDDMEARGNTHIGLGAAWGWRMLSPRWQGLWGGDMDANDLPLAYNTPRMNKAAIIMTDGDNTISNSSRGGYWYLSNGKLGTTSSSAAVTQLNSRLSSVCTAMKNNNIIVYTISFGSVNSTSATMLQNCATQADFYFPSPDNATLHNAFKQIGDSLSTLRVSR